MSGVTGPTSGVHAAYRLPPVTRPTAPRPAAGASPAAEVRQLPPRPAPVDGAPAGSDPALWAVLTSEERGFFTRQAALGPINYGPGRAAASADAPLGQRIDVRG